MEKLLEVVPGQLEIRSGGGSMSVFGVPFLAAGIFLALLGFRVIALTNADEIPEWGWPAMILMALVFSAAGGGLVLGRGWKTIDRSRGMITVRWGLLVPMRSSEHGLDEYNAVVLSHVAGDADSSERFPVGLQGKAPKTVLPLTSPASYALSREQAERIARTLGFPLIDRSTGHESVAEIQAPGHPLRDRFQNASAVRESVTAPPLMRSIVQRSPDATTITIPGPGFRLGAALQFAIPLGFALFVLLNIVPSSTERTYPLRVN